MVDLLDGKSPSQCQNTVNMMIPEPGLYIYSIPSTIVHQLGLVIVGATLAEWRWLTLSNHQTNWKSLSHGFGSIPS